MKISVLLLTLSLLVMTVLTCYSQERYEISGSNAGMPDDAIINLSNSYVETVFDSAFVVKGKYKFMDQLGQTPELVNLYASVNESPIYPSLFMGNEKIRISGSVADFPWDLDISGSEYQDRYNDLNKITKILNGKRNGLYKEFIRYSYYERAKRTNDTAQRIVLIDKQINAETISYIKANLNTHVAAIQLRSLKDKLPRDTLNDLYSQLPPELKTSQYGRILDFILPNKISEKAIHFMIF